MCLIQISGGLVELARAVVRYDAFLCSALLFPNVMPDTLLVFWHSSSLSLSLACSA